MPSETKLSPSEQLLQMASGYVIARCLYCAAKLNVADLLSEGPRSTSELAAATHTHPDALYRLLRALAMHGIFTEITPRVFALSPLAQVLRNDAPDSIRAMILFLGIPCTSRVRAIGVQPSHRPASL